MTRRTLRIAAFQHHPVEGPGHLAQWADNCASGEESPLPREHDTDRHRRVRDWFFNALDGWLENA
jgi:hypothetical protein